MDLITQEVSLGCPHGFAMPAFPCRSRDAAYPGIVLTHQCSDPVTSEAHAGRVLAQPNFSADTLPSERYRCTVLYYRPCGGLTGCARVPGR
jgi:hypothetical protein